MDNPPNLIDVWKISIPKLYGDESYYFSLLSDQEKTRAHAFVTKELMRKYVVTQGVLRHILASYISTDPKAIQFTFGSHRKPYVANAMQLQFNMTHSHDLALIGISFVDEVGIDIEMCDPKIVEKHLEVSVFSENELKAYAQVPMGSKTEAFIAAWTHKEALVKLAGKGLYKELKEVEVPLHVLHETSPVKYEDSKRYLKSFLLDEGYIGAVASTKPNFELRVQDYIGRH